MNPESNMNPPYNSTSKMKLIKFNPGMLEELNSIIKAEYHHSFSELVRHACRRYIESYKQRQHDMPYTETGSEITRVPLPQRTII